MWRAVLFVGAGSFLGGVARYLLSRLIQSHVASGFPWGTMTVNVAGCLLIGLLYGCMERAGWMNPELRLFLTVGFCGGFTTFSTFIHENYILLGGGHFLPSIPFLVLPSVSWLSISAFRSSKHLHRVYKYFLCMLFCSKR